MREGRVRIFAVVRLFVVIIHVKSMNPICPITNTTKVADMPMPEVRKGLENP